MINWMILLLRFEEVMNELGEPDVVNDQEQVPEADEGAE